MSADPRGARVLQAHLHYLATLAHRGGGACSIEDGIVTIANVHPLPMLINVCTRLDTSVPVGDVLARASDFFSRQGRDQYEVLALAGRDEDLLAAAAEQGMRVSADREPLQLLDRPPEPASAPVSDGVEIRWAETERDVAQITRVAHDAHRVYGLPDDLFPTVFASADAVLSPDLSAVLIERDGEALATAQVQIQDDTAYVGWVAVTASAGRLGLGTTVTRLVVQRGFDAGATAAVLLASPMGAPLYRRMGFEDVGEARGAVAQAT